MIDGNAIGIGRDSAVAMSSQSAEDGSFGVREQSGYSLNENLSNFGGVQFAVRMLMWRGGSGRGHGGRGSGGEGVGIGVGLGGGQKVVDVASGAKVVGNELLDALNVFDHSARQKRLRFGGGEGDIGGEYSEHQLLQ